MLFQKLKLMYKIVNQYSSGQSYITFAWHNSLVELQGGC